MNNIHPASERGASKIKGSCSDPSEEESHLHRSFERLLGAVGMKAINSEIGFFKKVRLQNKIFEKESNVRQVAKEF